MRYRTVTGLIIVVVVLSLLATVVLAQTAPPTLSMSPGSNRAQGQVDPAIVNPAATWVTILVRPFTGAPCTGPNDPGCAVLGTAMVQADGTWVVNMRRPVEANECAEVWFSFDNQATWQLWFGCSDTYPLTIPEPVTLALLGAGLAGLGAYMHKRRSPQS